MPAIRGDWAEVERRAAELIGHARDHRLGLWHAHGLAYRAEAPAERGELAAGIAGSRAALAGSAEAAARLRLTRVLARGGPSSQFTTREAFIAAAMQTCRGPVLASPTWRLRRAPDARAPR